MSIKIDPETQKAVDPERIGKNMPKRALQAVLIVAAIVATLKFCVGIA